MVGGVSRETWGQVIRGFVGSTLAARAELSEAWVSALRAGVLSFASPKESSQRKGDPWVGAAQAKRENLACCGRRPKKGKNQNGTLSAPEGLPGPLRGAEQRRGVGGLRLALSEPQASLASRPTSRVAQGTRVAGTDPGVAFFLATFSWPHKKKYARASSAEPCVSENNHTHQKTQSLTPSTKTAPEPRNPTPYRTAASAPVRIPGTASSALRLPARHHQVVQACVPA